VSTDFDGRIPIGLITTGGWTAKVVIGVGMVVGLVDDGMGFVFVGLVGTAGLVVKAFGAFED